MASRAIPLCGLQLCKLLFPSAAITAAQTTTATPAQAPVESGAPIAELAIGSSTDFFLIPGSDFDRPGACAKD
jgi:hypothetical protein